MYYIKTITYHFYNNKRNKILSQKFHSNTHRYLYTFKTMGSILFCDLTDFFALPPVYTSLEVAGNGKKRPLKRRVEQNRTPPRVLSWELETPTRKWCS